MRNEKLDYEVIYVSDPNSFFEEHKSALRLALDTETNSLNPFMEGYKVGCVTISFDGKKGYYLPFDKIDKKLFFEFLQNKYLIFANPKFDIISLYKCGVDIIIPDEDVNLLYHILNTSRKSNSIKALSWLIGFGGYQDDLDKFVKKYKIKNYLDIPEDLLFPYATLDAIVTYRLWEHAMKELVPLQPTIYNMYKEYLIPVIPVFVDMEIEGIPVDLKTLNSLDAEYKKKEEALSIEIKNIIKDENINVGSPEQIGRALQALGLPPHGITEKGFYETGDDALQLWKKEGFKIADLILQYRETSKMRSGFLGTKEEENDEEEDYTDEELFFMQKEVGKKKKKDKGIVKTLDSNNYVHPSYGIARTEPLRQMCSDPNIQQFPKDKIARTIFKLPENYIFGEFDISGFHLRLMAFLSSDPIMEDIFVNQSGDMHSMTGNAVFARGIPFEEFLSKKGQEPYKTYRQDAKAINFLFLYNGTPFVLKPVIELNWTEQQKEDYILQNDCEVERDQNGEPDLSYTVAKDIHKKFMDTYRGIPTYAQKQIKFAEDNGYIDSLLGSRRHLPQLRIRPSNPSKEMLKLLTHLRSVATNTEILSMEALMMHKALTRIHKELKVRNMKSKIILMIHDSVALKVYVPEKDQVEEMCIRHLQDFNCGKIPIIAESLFSNVWGFKN